MSYDIVNPPALGQPRGWNNGMLAPAGGRLLLVAGQTCRDETGRVPERDFVDQFAGALDCLLEVVRHGGGRPEDIGRMTVFVTDMDAYRQSLEQLGVVWRARMGRHYPAMALMEVSRLVDENALVEIEATAVIPPPDRLQQDRPAPSHA